MEENKVVVNSLRAWVLAARPKTLSGAAVPVLIGIAAAIALHGVSVKIVPAVLCMLFALIMQVDANFVNDYFDFMKGTDGEERLGPKRACSQGWITASAMRKGLLFTTAVACLVGLPLVFYGGWEMILVGFVCVVFCFLYTISFSYLGLGDILVLVFFGIVPVCLTYWLVSPLEDIRMIPASILYMSLGCGLVIDTLLIVNNYRDIENDRKSGKMTLIVRIGASGGRRLYFIMGLVAVSLNSLAVCDMGFLVMWLPMFYLALHMAASIEMDRIGQGRELNKVLGFTAFNMLMYGLLVSAGLVLSSLL